MAAKITNPAPGYIHGTKHEMDLALYEAGHGISEIGRIVTLYDGRKIAVLNKGVPRHIREELFHGLDLDKIINEEDTQTKHNW